MSVAFKFIEFHSNSLDFKFCKSCVYACFLGENAQCGTHRASTSLLCCGLLDDMKNDIAQILYQQSDTLPDRLRTDRGTRARAIENSETFRCL